MKKNLTKTCFALTIILLVTSCKKADQTPAKPISNNTTTDINGTTWSPIDSNFVKNEQILGLETFQDKLFVSYMKSYGNGDISLSGEVSYGKIIEHNFPYLLSGIGFDKLVSLDGNLYGLGLMDMYGSFIFNKDYFSGNMSLNIWNDNWISNTNQTSITSIGSEIIGSFGTSPYIRSKGNTIFPNLVDNFKVHINKLINYNGELICAGNFDSYNNITLNNIARWDGESWQALNKGLLGEVTDMAVINNDLYVCGKFESSGEGNTDCKYIAKWNGSSWSSLETGLTGGYNGGLVLRAYGNQLFVGGDFTGSKTISSPNIIKWKDGQWIQLAGGAKKPVGEIAVFQDHLYISNAFNSNGSNFLLKLQ